MHTYQHIVITGASSGIGAALAKELAAPGVRLALTGRNGERLQQEAQSCREKGAEVQADILDVTQRQTMESWIVAQDKTKPIDLVIANAGIAPDKGLDTGLESFDKAREIFFTNLDGVMNTVHPALSVMQQRGRGQIALMSSLASFHGFSQSPSYCGSKAAVRVYGEGLRTAYQNQGINVNVICPGFVKSRITDGNTFPMPQLMEGERAAIVIMDGLRKNKARISFPFPLSMNAWLTGVLPPGLVDRVVEWQLKRSAEKSAEKGSTQ